MAHWACSPERDGWRWHAVGDLCEIFDGPHATPKKTVDGPIFLGIETLVGGRLSLAAADHVSEQDFARWTRRVTPAVGDLVFSYETRLGEAALIPPDLRCCLGRRMGLLRVRSASVAPTYLLYAYRGPQFQEVIRQRTVHGSTVPRIPLKEMGRFPLLLPPRSEQTRIAAILNVIDEKIESNRRLAKLLEEIVGTLFRARFVDFVGAGALVESEVGLIPLGWRVRRLGDLGQVRGGGTPRTTLSEYWEPGEIVWLTPTDMTALKAPVVRDSRRRLSRSGLANSSATLLPRGTVLYTSRATLGLTAIARSDLATNQGFIAVVPGEGYSSEFVLFILRAMNADIVAKANGSTFLEVNKTSFRSIPFVEPPQGGRASFDQFARSCFGQIDALDREARTLTAIRDALLPRLVSGQVRVPDAADPDEVIGPAVEEATG